VITARSSSSWIQKIEEEVCRYLKDERSGHDPGHAFRVRDLAIRIAESIGADTEVVEGAALLHDIGHAEDRNAHARRGAFLATDILAQCSFPTSKVPAVVACIEFHHWKPDRAGDPPDPKLEYQAFADADRLDALGAIGIARTFAFGGAHGRPIWSLDTENTQSNPYGISSIHHFYDKLLRLPHDMYTELGRCLAARRVAVMEEFLRTFYLEWEGKDIEPKAHGSKSSLSLDGFPERTINVSDRV
jgi:uncharacterized protein